MNVKLPFDSFPLAWLGLLGLMILVVVAVIIVFRRKKFL